MLVLKDKMIKVKTINRYSTRNSQSLKKMTYALRTIILQIETDYLLLS